MGRTLRDALPEIVAGLVISAIAALITALRPEWHLLAWLSALALVVIVLMVSGLVRQLRRSRGRRVQEREYLQSVVRKYRIWKQRYLDLDVMTEGIDVDLAEDITIHPAMYMLVEKLDASSRPDLSPAEERLKEVKVDLLDVLGKFDQVALLGEPGSGKTTQMQWLALHFAEVALRDGRHPPVLPVLVELARYKTGETVEGLLKRCLREDHGRSGAFLAQYLESYLEGGSLVLLLDGIDQLPFEGYRDAVDHLHEFASTWGQNKFVFSCRTLDYEHSFGRPRLLIAPLEEHQIEDFALRYLPDTGAELVQQLGRGDRALLDLARNPFMLRMMTLVHRREGRLPAVRPRLLDEFVQVLLGREKGERWLSTAECESVLRGLSSLAFAMTERGEAGAAVQRVWADGVLVTSASSSSYQGVFSGGDLLKLASDASLMALSPSRGTVQYYHELLQEYFSALALTQRWQAGDDLHSECEDPWWDPTIVICCALVDNPDDLVLGILKTLEDERGPLLAGACCAEAGPLLSKDTIGAVVASLEGLLESRMGPLGTRVMDTIARIDYSRIEDMVLEVSAAPPELREHGVVLALGARYGRIEPIYMGPFFWATRDRTWEPRAYAASIIRTRGSERIAERLLGLLVDTGLTSGFDLMIAGVLADMAPPSAAQALIGLLASGSHSVRMEAARGLGNIAAVEAEPLLTSILTDPSESKGLRQACAFALLHILGAESLESLTRASWDSEVREIVSTAISEFQPMAGLQSTYEPHDWERGIPHLVGRDPAELVRSITNVYEGRLSSRPAEAYRYAAALALTADSAFIPELKKLEKARRRQVDFHPFPDYKLREVLWWTIEAIRDKRRRRGRPPRLSPYPRDWSAFGASPR
jgi:HEAT repeat protein